MADPQEYIFIDKAGFNLTKGGTTLLITCTITFFNRMGCQGNQSKPNMLSFRIM
jgi:hypothetical protein